MLLCTNTNNLKNHKNVILWWTTLMLEMNYISTLWGTKILCNHLMLCCGDNIAPLDFNPLKKNILGTPFKLNFILLHYTLLIDSPISYTVSNFGLHMLWTLSFILCLSLKFSTWFDMNNDYIEINFYLMVEIWLTEWRLLIYREECFMYWLTLLDWIIFELKKPCFP